MEVACEIEMIKDPETRKSNITYVARHIEDALTSQREYRAGCAIRLRHCLAKSCCLWFGKRYGNYLICLYLITKSLYIMNVVGQFFLMNKILGTNYTFYGLDLLRDISEGYVWQESGNFPRITMCDFEVRQVANKHRHSVQCVLPINMFNEKIFIFLWFWFILVAAVNTSSFLYWSYKSSIHGARVQFIRKFLKLRDSFEHGDKKRSLTFVDSYLRQDGVFILRLTAQNAGELVASEIVERLWLLYKSHQTSYLAKLNQRTIIEQPNSNSAHSDNQEINRQHQHRMKHLGLLYNHQRDARSLTPVNSSSSNTHRVKPPPVYSEFKSRITEMIMKKEDIPPPLPPPPNSNSLDGTSRSLTNNSQDYSHTPDNMDQIIRLRPQVNSDRNELSNPIPSDLTDENSRKLNRKHRSRHELSNNKTLPVKSTQRHQTEEDPGEFV